MSERRRARVERFRSNLISRTRNMTARLLARMQGVGAVGDEQEVARELHSLKGDARMLGLVEIAEVAHAAESLLVVGGAARTDGRRIVQALDQLIAGLEGRLGDEEATRAQLRAEAAELAAAGEAAELAPAAADAEPGQTVDPAGAVVAATAEARWVSIEARRLDELGEGLNEFAFDLRALHHETRAQARAATAATRRVAIERLETLDRLAARLDALVDRSWTLRLSLLEPILQDLARHARELAQAQGKQLRTVVRCARVQLERSVCEQLWDPLLHLIRNAIDHGVEPPSERGDKSAEALLLFSAEPVGPNVVIEVYDDGRGVDSARVRAAAVSRGVVSAEQALALDERAALDLIFRHGFSTRTEVGELSGRGVGLDVVRHVVERLGGSARVVSDLGQGTRFLLDIPASIGQERVLVVDCAGGLYGIPSRNVREVVRLPPGVEKWLPHGPDQLPFVLLDTAVGVVSAAAPRFGLVIEVQNRRWAFGSGRLIGEHELVRRPVDDLLGGSGLIGAAAALADGRLVLILSASELTRRSGEVGVLPTPVMFTPDAPPIEEEPNREEER